MAAAPPSSSSSSSSTKFSGHDNPQLCHFRPGIHPGLESLLLAQCAFHVEAPRASHGDSARLPVACAGVQVSIL